MVDHDKCGNFNVLDVFEYELEEIQTHDVVEEELELSLDEGFDVSNIIPKNTCYFAIHDFLTLSRVYTWI